MMVMVAHGHAEDFFGLLLADDKAVEIFLYIARLLFEENLWSFRFLVGGGSLTAGGGLRFVENADIREVLPHEISHLALKLLWIGWAARYFLHTRKLL